MAKKSKSPQLTETALNRLAASVHTYDSFGRAVVSAALSEAAKSAASFATPKVTATVQVAPIPQQSASVLYSPASAGAGGAATGTVPPQSVVTICFGESCFTIQI